MKISPFIRLAAGMVAFSSVSGIVNAQFPASNVTMYANRTLAFFGAASGNDCWGYTSPSGREYAIMGLDNAVAFVEITNPASPTTISIIPHTGNNSSSWGDIKVYGHYAYAVTEDSGTGIQVIDMSQIDNGTVTLVRTITSPGRSHNLVLNTESGFLYTCGSNEGTGTTMCFSLANPSNPVQVGAPSMTMFNGQSNYQHDANVVNWTTGALAGHELWFGCSEGRGVDIYDFTNKNTPVHIKRITYPDMGYCHQAWLSKDRKYLYVDDEFDENNLAVPTRSLIFNVEDPANAFYVGTFSSGVLAIDHNQYVHEGFTFQANYRSGLRIFDLAGNPEAPVQTGYFDTYPANNNTGYNGAWSNYPFFPSGTVIVSDINRGLFVLNVLDATTRSLVPNNMNIVMGLPLGGNLSSLFASDDNRVLISYNPAVDDLYPIHLETTTTAVDTDPRRIRVSVDSSMVGTSGFLQSIDLFDWNTNSYETVNTRVLSSTDTVATTGWVTNPDRFVNQTNREVKVRVTVQPWLSDQAKFTAAFDRVTFEITQ